MSPTAGGGAAEDGRPLRSFDSRKSGLHIHIARVRLDSLKATRSEEESMGANADLVRSFWDAFGRRDLDRARAHADDEAEIVIPETVPWGGTYRGPGGFQEMMGGVLGQFEDFRPSPESFLEAEDDQVAVPVNVQGRAKSGKDFSGRALWLYRVRDGKIVRAEVFMDTAKALEALR
jgi:uncharacterized protein